MSNHSTPLNALSLRVIEFVSVSHMRILTVLMLISLAFFIPGIVSLQPMDRDEPRFAQASKQMLESHDFIDIRFQNDTRYKKPVGIYWLQSASVALADAFGAQNATRTIFYYRLPSLLGAITAVLLTYWTALAFLPKQTAFLSAAMMSGCLLLGVEARLAKTDAILLATVLFTMGTLARLWFANMPLSKRHIIAFWIVLGISILIKGPMTLMVAGLAISVLCIKKRSVQWLLVLRPKMGALIVASIVLPWLIAIIAKTGTAFFNEAIGKDMLGKVAGGQERHGGYPGTYLAVFWATFWPIAPIVALATPFIYKNRKSDPVLFLLAWIIPSWLVFELVPTKLPHYVLPLYPAFAILVMLAIENNSLRVQALWTRIIIVLAPLIPVVFLVAMPVVFLILDHSLPFLALPFLALGAFLSVLAWRELLNNAYFSGLITALLASWLLTIATYPFGLPQLRSINLSTRLADAANSVNCTNKHMTTTTYREPSLIFLTATELLLTDAVGAAQFMSQQGCQISFIGSTIEQDFLENAGKLGVHPQFISRVQGLNINSGKKVDIGVYAKVE